MNVETIVGGERASLVYMEKIHYQTFNNCLRLTNGVTEIIVSTDFGPRILAYNTVGGENVLGIHAEFNTVTALGEYKFYGGHRLWIAPENSPNTYAPDSASVKYETNEKTNSVRLIQPVEPVTRTQKEITISLDTPNGGAKIHHKITNVGDDEIEVAVWALTIMRDGGEVMIPNEPFVTYTAKTLLPVRNLTLWSYTDLTDSRWTFDRDSIRLRPDKNKPEPQKIGVLNKRNYVEYRLPDVVFTKRFEYIENAAYPDMNSNVEVYTAGNFTEIETLAPLVRLTPGSAAEHVEFWELSEPNTK